MARGLTPKQFNILEFVKGYLVENGYPPTIREIGSHFNITSLRGVTVHLDALAHKGMIERGNTSRSIKVMGFSGLGRHTVGPRVVPILGSIAAGIPIEAVEDVEGEVSVPDQMLSNVTGAFALRVKGDSMIGDHIDDGDIVIIKPQQDAREGEIVAVRIEDEATVKRVHYDGGRVLLMPSNERYQPIEVNRENSGILGRVVGLIRTI